MAFNVSIVDFYILKFLLEVALYSERNLNPPKVCTDAVFALDFHETWHVSAFC